MWPGKHVGRWLAPCLLQAVTRRPPRPRDGRAVHVLFCFVDHFEPTRPEQVEAWLERYPKLTARHRDSDGVPPQHTWFFPGEQYRAEYLEALTTFARQGLGEVELHLHHHYDTSATLRERIQTAVENFGRHGALVTRGEPGLVTYGFIHGNMALDNSMGDPRWCGVDNELDVLRETGCFADFSMPTAPAVSQTRTINAIYYAVDDPTAPRSHDRGVRARVGMTDREGLLIIQGPLALDWRRRRFGLLPGVDNAEIMRRYPGTPERVRRWVRQHVHVAGRPEWIVVKVSCHGAEERHFGALLGDDAEQLHAHIEARFRDRPGYRLHYVTARELYNVVKAAEAGHDGDPGRFRDFRIPPYLNREAVVVPGHGHDR